jgi:hypothetical protein
MPSTQLSRKAAFFLFGMLVILLVQAHQTLALSGIHFGTQPLVRLKRPATFANMGGMPTTFVHSDTLTAGDPLIGASFGHPLDMSGNTLVVAANYGQVYASEQGIVYVYERTEAEPFIWNQVAILTDGDTVNNYQFARAVAIDGDMVAVSTIDGGGLPGTSTGSVLVFERNEGGPNAWGRVAILTASDGQPGDVFGWSVAVSGDSILAGSPYEDGGDGDPLNDAGAAYVFERNEGGPNAWGETTKLVADFPEAGDNFGFSTAISGDNLIVGAFWGDGEQDNPIPNLGGAYLFSRNSIDPTLWDLYGQLIPQAAQEDSRFGTSVALENDRVVVGAFGENGGLNNSLPFAGAAYVFEYSESLDEWVDIARLTAADAQTDDSFGLAVDLSGDIVAVGTANEDGGAGDPVSGAGTTYLFERDQGGSWYQSQRLANPTPEVDDAFGADVAINEHSLVVGALGENGGAPSPLPDSGAVYVYLRLEAVIYLPVVAK